LSNSDVRIEINDKTCEYVPKGAPLEVGMLQFLTDNEIDITDAMIQRNIHQKKFTQLPFDQTLKRMTVIRRHPTNENMVRIVVKGAPEYLIEYCTHTFNEKMMIVEITDGLRDTILNDLVFEMASQPLKVLSYAYKEMEIQVYNQLMQVYGEESEQFRIEIERELTYLGTFGLEDRLRPDVAESIELIRFGKVKSEDADIPEVDQSQGRAGDMDGFQRMDVSAQPSTSSVNVRMMSGDHIETCKKVALKAHIISQDEYEKDDGAVVSGEQFRQMIGPVNKVWDEKKQEYIIEFVNGKSAFDAVKRKVKVVARCTSMDKYIFISGIKQKGGLVGMTGESIHDADALEKADVGFCMGSGCDVAKDCSDLVILDNDFESIHRSIKWGRSIFDNVIKFMQFQLTINIVICFITILGVATVGFAPLNVV
jgi:magnesium-transporting ATPase (P-type)